MQKSRKQWTSELASRFLDEADQRKSDRVYAEENGIKEQRLRWWRRRLDRKRRGLGAGKKRRRPVDFVEVVPSAPRLPFTLEVMLTNGRQFRIGGDVDTKVIRRLADALEKRC